MMQLVNAQEVSKEKMEATSQTLTSDTVTTLPSIDQHPTTQLILSSRFILHHPDAGINPLVDAAAKLFSTMGKLKYKKCCENLNVLHEELVVDIHQFQETVKAYTDKTDYLEEYLPIAIYILCTSLDDIISNSPWGNQGKWQPYQLLTSFGLERLSNQNFLIILERFIRDPEIYIDIMEFVYICFSLGFKSHFTNSEGDQEQLQQITYSLYKRIRSFRGNFSKSLSPFPIKPRINLISFGWKNIPFSLIITSVIAISCFIFLTGSYLVNKTFHHTTSTFNQAERTLNEKHHE